MFKTIKRFLGNLRCFVIADASDNSITFSKGLCNKMRLLELDKAMVMTFLVSDSGRYAFTINPPFTEDETQLAEVSYNGKYRCIGYECLVPTVNRIFYDYGLPMDSRCKLSVHRKETVSGLVYWEICRPPKRKPANK